MLGQPHHFGFCVKCLGDSTPKGCKVCGRPPRIRRKKPINKFTHRPEKTREDYHNEFVVEVAESLVKKGSNHTGCLSIDNELILKGLV